MNNFELIAAGADALDRCWTTRELGKALRNLTRSVKDAEIYVGLPVYSAIGTKGMIYNVNQDTDPIICIRWVGDSPDSIIRKSQCDQITLL